MSTLATQPVPDKADLQQIERRARRFWVGLIVTLLGIQVIVGLGSVYLALGDPTVAVIPNYHQSALDWDIKHRAQQLLERLKWQVTVEASSIAADQRTLQVRIEGPQGEPIELLNVRGKVYHHARGQEIAQVVLKETTAGNYAGQVPITRPGLWQIELAIEGDHGIANKTTTIEVE